MKLAFTTLGCPDWSFDKIVEEAERLGFEALEIRGIDGQMRAEEIPLFFPENAETTKKRMESRRLKICGFGTSAKFHDDGAFEASVDEGKKAIDVCQRMGIPYIRVFGDQIAGEEVREHVISQAAKGIRMLCEYAEGKGVGVLLEVHGNFNTIEAVCGVAGQLKDRPEFGILWDIEHSDKTYGDGWRAFYDQVKPYIKHTHIKDHKRNGGRFDLCLVGEGDIPIADIVKTLQADGYDGYFSLEWEKKWHPELPDPSVALPGYLEFMRGL
ncbi:MAG: sugar phosphate isomerase/epimerase [Provencibacterium sp.]|jgi:sugar phosphate isomerase/epimerase|nr:sugar phosphate isomerase/epimerase [Provencibacterium sp.]